MARAYAHGIYTLLDAHQDVLSEKFCGEGVPLWAAQPRDTAGAFPAPLSGGPYKTDARGYPLRSDCAKHAWADYYFSEAAASAFQGLYTNASGLTSAFADFWAEVRRASRPPGLAALIRPRAGGAAV